MKQILILIAIECNRKAAAQGHEPAISNLEILRGERLLINSKINYKEL
jgi:hypothetical protein